jgi:hypothetical protein
MYPLLVKVNRILDEAWALTKGSKRIFWSALISFQVVWFFLLKVVGYALSPIWGASSSFFITFGAESPIHGLEHLFLRLLYLPKWAVLTASNMNGISPLHWLLQWSLIHAIVLPPVTAGFLMLGVSRAIGQPLRVITIFQFFKKAPALIGVTFISGLAVTAGLICGIIPGIILTVVHDFAVLLVVVKGLPPVMAFKVALRAAARAPGFFFLLRLSTLLLLSGPFFALDIPPAHRMAEEVFPSPMRFFIFAIFWFWPLSLIVIGLGYREVFGSEDSLTEEYL